MYQGRHNGGGGNRLIPWYICPEVLKCEGKCVLLKELGKVQ
jgi:hypothetical protein